MPLIGMFFTNVTIRGNHFTELVIHNYLHVLDLIDFSQFHIKCLKQKIASVNDKTKNDFYKFLTFFSKYYFKIYFDLFQ